MMIFSTISDWFSGAKESFANDAWPVMRTELIVMAAVAGVFLLAALVIFVIRLVRFANAGKKK